LEEVLAGANGAIGGGTEEEGVELTGIDFSFSGANPLTGSGLLLVVVG